MSSWGKFGLLLSGFCIIVIAGARFVLGTWYPILYVFLGLLVLGLLVSLILDYKFYLDFLSMKTTKTGLSLGWSLLLLIVLLVAIGYLGNRFNKTFDFTAGKINSLANQSQEVLKSLDKDTTVRVFFKGDKISQNALMAKSQIKDNLFLYKQATSHFKVLYIDTYKNNLEAETYLQNLPDKNNKEIFVFVTYEGRKVRVEEPFTEEKITSALIKVKKRETKEIYFLVGHGEKDFKSDEPSGLKIFEQFLRDSGLLLKEWSFIQDGVPQQNPALVISAGPRRPFLPAELTWLQNYLSQNGRLILALDPKDKHNLNPFLKGYGVVFNDDFIVSQLGVLYGGVTKALGIFFDFQNQITKRFHESGKQAVFFEKASSLDVDTQKSDHYKYSHLVKSHDKSFPTQTLSKSVKVQNMKSLTMALEVKPKDSQNDDHAGHDHAKEEDHKIMNEDAGFRLVVFGDSDFLTNRYFYEGVNKDLILNTVVSLLGEEDLVTIRPKQPKGTKITLTRMHRMGVILWMITLPILLLIVSLVLWYRRREA